MSPDRAGRPRGAIPLKPIPLLLGLAAFVLIALFPGPFQDLPGGGRRAAFAAGLAVMMALWWITEATSIYLTALVPLVLFPLLGITGDGGPLRRIAGAVLPYLDAYIFLFLGGMAIAAAMQQWNLHSRVALNILRAIGTRAPMVLLGMLLASALVSLWISNTAAAAMMLPIGLALVAQMEAQAGGGRRVLFGGAVMLSIAYGANIGGMGTKIGTPPNLVFCGFASREMGREVSFLEFLAIGLPFVAAFLPLAWWALWRSGRGDAPRGEAGREAVLLHLRALGSMSRGEWTVLLVFLLTAVLWFLGQPLHALLAPALKPLFARIGASFQSKHVEAGTALLGMLILLVLPVRVAAEGEGRPRIRMALELRWLRRIPWESLVLLGGGFALAEGIEASGLSAWMGSKLAGFRDAPLILQYLAVALTTVFVGAIASNSATAGVMMVVLKSAASEEALPLMAVAALAASCDFMLPAGTPPNAIVFGSGYLTIPRMARVGFLVDLAGAALLALWGITGIRWILG